MLLLPLEDGGFEFDGGTNNLRSWPQAGLYDSSACLGKQSTIHMEGKAGGEEDAMFAGEAGQYSATSPITTIQRRALLPPFRGKAWYVDPNCCGLSLSSCYQRPSTGVLFCLVSEGGFFRAWNRIIADVGLRQDGGTAGQRSKSV